MKLKRIKSQIVALRARIIGLKLEEPYHPEIPGLIQQLDKLDELQRQPPEQA